jgi:hypothetical protein
VTWVGVVDGCEGWTTTDYVVVRYAAGNGGVHATPNGTLRSFVGSG